MRRTKLLELALKAKAEIVVEPAWTIIRHNEIAIAVCVDGVAFRADIDLSMTKRITTVMEVNFQLQKRPLHRFLRDSKRLTGRKRWLSINHVQRIALGSSVSALRMTTEHG